MHRLPLCFVARENYELLKSVSVDADSLPDDYDEFVEASEAFANDMAKDGFVVVRVEVEPAALVVWCEMRGNEVDADSRSQFATSRVVGLGE